MAKIALICVFFALFAVCMAARVPRDEPATPSPLETLVDKLLTQAREALSPENQKIWAEKIQTGAKEGLNALQDLSRKIDESIQSAKLPETK